MRQGSQHPRVERRYFAVGCAFSTIALALAIWAFKLGTLSSDQRALVRILLSAAIGFAAGSFVGSLAVESKRLAPGLVTTATGGFGVWLLLFWFWPQGTAESAFFVTIRPHGTHGQMDIVCKGATVTLDLDGDRRAEIVSTKGEARFDGIPSALSGRQVPTFIECAGYSIVGDSRIALVRDSPVYLPLAASGAAAPARDIKPDSPPDAHVGAPPDAPEQHAKVDTRCRELASRLATLMATYPDPCTLEQYPMPDDRQSCAEKETIRIRSREAGCR